MDPTKADAIRRTIYVGNVPQVVTEEELISFFTPCGSVKFVRIQGDPTAPSKYDTPIPLSTPFWCIFFCIFFWSLGCFAHNPTTSPLRRFAFVEFGGEANVAAALLLNGATMRDRALKVNRSKNAITKPTVRFPARRSK